ncbi:hypothetical protein BDZ89DRAFT_1064799 [Hymenopellis radicata]|nr:hypothetical protein BDZ89DRAFT_1064799 [Hymenopellis radicata]
MLTAFSFVCFLFQIALFASKAAAHSLNSASHSLADRFASLGIRSDSAINISYVPSDCTSDCSGLVNIVACGDTATSCMCSTSYNATVLACMNCVKDAASSTDEVSLSTTLQDMYETCEEEAAIASGNSSRLRNEIPGILRAVVITTAMALLLNL